MTRGWPSSISAVVCTPLLGSRSVRRAHSRPQDDGGKSPRIAPHATHRGLAPGRRELAHLDEAEALVAVVVRAVARFEVGGRALLVQPAQVLREQAHPLALSAVVRVGAEQAQLPVRPVAGMT